MHRQTLRTWFSHCTLVLTVVACSSTNVDGGASDGGNGGTAGSDASGGTGTTGGKSASGKGGTVGTAGQTGGVTMGGSSTTGGSANADAGAPSDAGSGNGDQVVGKSGGVVAQGGVMLDIPANALTTETPITVTTTTAPAGYTLASKAFQFGPDGTTFAQPVAVTIPLLTATPGAHVFWSNASNGFDDIGGTVNGLSVTAHVTHFSRGFCAVPDNQGAGGASGEGGAADVSGGAGAGGAQGGTAGTATGGAGAGGTSGGGAGGSGGSGSALCTTTPLNLPGIKVTATAGTPPDSSTYTGGTLKTGTDYQTGDAHYGASTYSGPLQAQYKVDAVAQTIQIGERAGGATYYIGMTYTQTDAHTLHATIVCNTSPSNLTTLDYNYTFVPGTLTMSVVGSEDVMTFPAQ